MCRTTPYLANSHLSSCSCIGVFQLTERHTICNGNTYIIMNNTWIPAYHMLTVVCAYKLTGGCGRGSDEAYIYGEGPCKEEEQYSSVMLAVTCNPDNWEGGLNMCSENTK